MDTGNRQWALDQKISDIECVPQSPLLRECSQFSLSVALHQWNSNLPEVLKNTVKMRSNPTPHLLQLHLTFHWSFILLHRPFYKRRSKTVVARENVIDHAKVSLFMVLTRIPTPTAPQIDLQTRFRRHYGTTERVASTLHPSICTDHTCTNCIFRWNYLPSLGAPSRRRCTDSNKRTPARYEAYTSLY